MPAPSKGRKKVMKGGDKYVPQGVGGTPPIITTSQGENDIDDMINMLSELANDMPKSSKKKGGDEAWLDKLLALPDIGKMLKTEMKRDKVENIQKRKQQRTQEKLSYLEQREQEYRRRIEADQKAMAAADANREHFEYEQQQRARSTKKTKRKGSRSVDKSRNTVMFRPALTETATPLSRKEHEYHAQKYLESEARVARMQAQENQFTENKRRELDLQLELADLRLQEIKNQQKRDIERKREGRRERTMNAKEKAEAALREKTRQAQAKVRQSQERQARVDFEKSKRDELRNVRRQIVMKILSMPNLKELIMQRLGDYSMDDHGPTSIRGSPRSLGRDEIHDSFVYGQENETDDGSVDSEGSDDNGTDEGDVRVEYIREDKEDSPPGKSVPSNQQMAVGSAVRAARNRTQSQRQYEPYKHTAAHSSTHNDTSGSNSSQQVALKFEDTPFGVAAKVAEAAFIVAASSNSSGVNMVFDDSAFRRAAALSQSEQMTSEPREEVRKTIQYPMGEHMNQAKLTRSLSAGRSRNNQDSRTDKPSSNQQGKMRSRPKSAGASRKVKHVSPGYGLYERERESQLVQKRALIQQPPTTKEEMMEEIKKMQQRAEQEEAMRMQQEQQRAVITMSNTRSNSAHQNKYDSVQVVKKQPEVSQAAVREVNPSSHNSSSGLVNKLLDLLHEEQAYIDQHQVRNSTVDQPSATIERTGSLDSPVPITRSMSNYSPDFYSPTSLASTAKGKKSRRKSAKTIGGNRDRNRDDLDVSGVSEVAGSVEGLAGMGNISTGTASTVGERQLQRIQAMQASTEDINCVSNLSFNGCYASSITHSPPKVKPSTNQPAQEFAPLHASEGEAQSYLRHENIPTESDHRSTPKKSSRGSRGSSRVQHIRDQTVLARQQQFHGYNVP